MINRVNEAGQPVPPPPAVEAPTSADKCMGKGKHAWQWVWMGVTNMTDKRRCGVCGIVTETKRFSGQ